MAKVSGGGVKTLEVGANIFNIVVTTEDGTSKTYKITVNRSEDPTNTSLSSLTVSKGTLDSSFSLNTTNYTVYVGNEVSSIKIQAISADMNGVVTGIGYKTLQVGQNVYSVTIRTPDGESKKYTITVNRAASSNALLRAITLDKGKLSPTFNSTVTEYTVNVWNELSSINIMSLTQSSVAKVSGGGVKTLEVGENIFNIVVTAEDGTTKTYIITINRSAVSTNTSLSSLTISKGTLSPFFSPETTNYFVNVGNEVTSLTLKATSADANGMVTGTGYKTLRVGENTFTVTITTPDGASKKYTITVYRAA